MTATEELRRLLDERGVEWWPMHDIESGYREDRDTEFLIYGCKHVAHEWGCRLQIDMLTPEQAVAATLGPGTCKLYRGTSGLIHVTTGHCSECGAEVVKGTKDGYRSRYCQWCGSKVVS